MYSTRGALGLLWRASTNWPENARLWSDSEIACGRKLQTAGLVNIDSRTDKEGEAALFASATEKGRDAFECILHEIERLCAGASIDEVFGSVQ